MLRKQRDADLGGAELYPIVWWQKADGLAVWRLRGGARTALGPPGDTRSVCGL